MQQRSQIELEKIEEVVRARHEDVAYTKQYFTIGRQAHVRTTQSLGTPALVWHVAFWPKGETDPQNIDDAAATALDDGNAELAKPLTRRAARDLYNERRDLLRRDLNKLLRRLQTKGRVPARDGRYRDEVFEKPTTPADWESNSSQTPINAFASESITFTIWWSDEPRALCPVAPPEPDLRVRVQADIHPDFASVTFIIDAGRPWTARRPSTPGAAARPHVHYVGDAPPVYEQDDTRSEDEVALTSETVPGARRRRIFHAARIARHSATGRLEQDRAGARSLLPEDGVSPETARRLLWASDTLYKTIWDEFCTAFEVRLNDIAGETDKIFANFRGVVLAAPEKLPDFGKTPEDERSPLSRFVYGARGSRSALNNPYPNAVVKSYWPFIRRTRSEADHRDWIACGIFDWRAIYITALGGQSELYPGDEGAADDDATAGFLPERALHEGGLFDSAGKQRRLDEMLRAESDAELRARIQRAKAGLDFPQTVQGDRPAAFHYVLLTSGEPDRRQVGRMIDRVNMLGTIRLYAMKDFSVIRDADVHLRIYGQLLDRVMRQATSATNAFIRDWWRKECCRVRDAIAALRQRLDELENGYSKEEGGESLAQRIREAHEVFERELTLLVDADSARASRAGDDTTPEDADETEPLPNEHALLHYRRLLNDIVRAGPPTPVESRAGLRRLLEIARGGSQGPSTLKETIFSLAREDLRNARRVKSERDEELALINRQTDRSLTRIKTYVDELGQDAVGGLPFRINRARYYAEMYRSTVRTLRVGSIDTWWDYEQLASRGVDPPLKFIEAVGDRLEKQRTRLRDAMEAVQTSAIANQTEATRDNTYQLEVIARGIEALNIGVAEQKRALLAEQREFTRLRRLMYVLYLLMYVGLAVLVFLTGRSLRVGPMTVEQSTQQPAGKPQ